MAALKTAKYLREAPTRPTNHPEVTSPIPTLTSDENFGDLGFHIYWEAVTAPFTMNPAPPHKHEFPQYLNFIGGDITNMLDLGGEIELTLSEDGKNLEKHTITKATSVYIPAGLYHCPLVFKKVTKPILFMDVICAGLYKKLGKA
jgi:hypothetical protein